jgi:hypothetical protein
VSAGLKLESNQSFSPPTETATDPSWLAEMAFCGFVEKVTFRGRLKVRNFWVKCLEGTALKTFTGSRGMWLCGRLPPIRNSASARISVTGNGDLPAGTGRS